MDDDIEIFKGKKFSDLCKDIYENSKNTRNQIDILITELRNKVNSLNEALTIVPLIKDYLDVGVKNDDHLVKLAGVVQRIQTRKESSGTDDFSLTEEEKQQLLSTVDEISKEQSYENEKVDDIIKSSQEKIKNV